MLAMGKYVPIRRPVLDRFHEKYVVDLDTKCWTWIAYKNKDGYGFFNDVNFKIKQAHRWSYTTFVGEIPQGLEIDHICRNRACVNPGHLRVVTHRVNTLENSTSPSAINRNKTHCKYGHEFTEENTYRFNGGRACKICSIRNARRNYAKNRRQK